MQQIVVHYAQATYFCGMIKTLNPDFQNTIRERLRGQHFMALLGFEVTKIAEGWIEGELILTPSHQQHKGFVRGGVTAANPGVGEKLFAKGWVLKQGRKLNFCEAEVYCLSADKSAVLIAKASATMATINPEEVEIKN